MKTSRQIPRVDGDDFNRVEAARALRISVDQLDYATKTKAIGCYRHGRHVTYGQAHLDKYRLTHEEPISERELQRLVATVRKHSEQMQTLLEKVA